MLDHEDPSVASKFTLRRARGGRTRSVPSSVHGAPLVRPPPPPSRWPGRGLLRCVRTGTVNQQGGGMSAAGADRPGCLAGCDVCGPAAAACAGCRGEP